MVLVAAGVLALNLDALLVQTINPKAPRVGPQPIQQAVLRNTEPRRSLGPCWWQNHRGQHVLYAEGTPYTLGFCSGALADTDDVLDHQEQALTDALDTFVPLKALQFTLIRVLATAYRGLSQHMTRTDQLEIKGITDGRVDRWQYLGPTFGRILYYHALHDISQAMIDNPLLAACTAFAATGTATKDGHTLLARNFDFEAGRVFDEDKVIVFYRPDVGLPFVSVVWGGMAGAVSGMNSEGLGVVLNAAGSDRLDTEGRPTTLVLRSILQLATSVDEAVQIVENADILVADIFTVADGKTGEMAVIEMAPGKVAVRRSGPTMMATNHFLHPDFGDDEENQRRLEDGTTGTRYRRLEERLSQALGTLDVPTAIDILRDRRQFGGAKVGLGHRGSIDALIAAHSVVFDLTERRLWVSASPHTLGAYVAYDLRDLLRTSRLKDLGALPADPLLADGAFERITETRRLVERAKQEDNAAKMSTLQHALSLTEDYPPALLHLAEACEQSGDPACAVENYERFLAMQPAYADSRRRAEARLRALNPALHQAQAP